MLSDVQSWARLRSLRVRAITLDLQYIIHTGLWPYEDTYIETVTC